MLILGSKQVDIAIPEVFVGGLLGSMLIFLFSAWACAAVGRTAQEVVNEVRRQFIERPGIMVSIQSLFLHVYLLRQKLTSCNRSTRRSQIIAAV